MRILTGILWLLLAIKGVDVAAQRLQYLPDTNWKVFSAGQEMRLAFSGGFNNPQFSMGDLNNDGVSDLIVFEKGSSQIKTFINYGAPGNPDYRYRPAYAENFPTNNAVRAVNSYLKLEDLNCDQVPDLITRGNAGFSIYYGYYQRRELHFQFYKELYYSPISQTQEGFESSVFPDNGWQVKNEGDKGWKAAASGTEGISAKQGNRMAMFQSGEMALGSTALLISRSFRISPNLKSEGKISLWVYRSNASGSDSLSVFINDKTILEGATYLGGVACNRSISLPDTRDADGWYEYTFQVPFSITGTNLYFILKGVAGGGQYLMIDDIRYRVSNFFGDVNAYVETGGDIPGIVDVDGDGDLDFFSYYIGGGYISFYKNYQKEEGLPCDSIHINLKDACWGKVYQGSTVEQTLGIHCQSSQPQYPPAKVTHTGNTLCMFDYDGDGDIDYLNGGVGYHTIQFLRNGKNDFNYPLDTIVEQDTAWQTTGHSYSAFQFPAAFYLDIDQDGKKDILISPSAELASANYRNIAFYRNTGTNSNPSFTYQHDSLLCSEAIELGSGSYPMLYDYDRDGKLDLFVGGDGYFENDGSFRARIAYFRNISGEGTQAFRAEDLNFLDIDSLYVKGAYPAVGDLDNDGLDDLVIGHANGTLSFYKNYASNAAEPPVWRPAVSPLRDANLIVVDSNQHAAPFIYDLDKDGKKDLLIGGQSGWIAFYRNAGGSNQLSLQYKTGKLGGVRADPWNFLSGYSAPFIGRIDSSDKEYLVVGSGSGRLMRYTGFENGSFQSAFQIVDSAYHDINKVLGLYSGFRSVPAFGDLNGDGPPEMVMGNILGGILIFSQQIVHEQPSPEQNIRIYPNPATNRVFVEWDNSFAKEEQVQISLINLAGQRFATYRVPASTCGFATDIGHLASGLYLVEIISGSNRAASKLVVIR